MAAPGRMPVYKAIMIPALMIGAVILVVTLATNGGSIFSGVRGLAQTAHAGPGEESFLRVASSTQNVIRKCYVYGAKTDPACAGIQATLTSDTFGRHLDEVISGRLLDDAVLRDPNDLQVTSKAVVPIQYNGHTVYGGFVEFKAHLQDRAHERYVDKCEMLSFLNDVEFDHVWDYAVGPCGDATIKARQWHTQ